MKRTVCFMVCPVGNMSHVCGTECCSMQNSSSNVDLHKLCHLLASNIIHLFID